MRKTSARGAGTQVDPGHLSTEKTLWALGICPLKAYLIEGAVWLAVSISEAKLLHNYAIGNSEGGPLTARHTAVQLDPLSGPVQPGLISIRLSPEESFFLAHAVGNVQFVGKDSRTCSVKDVWKGWVTANPGFVHSCIAYQHFRSKGWIPRSGLQYGTDLVLYEQHPSLVHSTVCVLIVPMPYSLLYSPQSGAADPKLVLDGQDGKLAWHDVEGLNRLCVRVGKRLMLLYVQPQCADLDITTPACLDSFAVAEHMVDRWVPEASVNLM